MNHSNEDLSRMNRNKRNQSDKIVNWLIAGVVLAIVLAAFVIFSSMNKNQTNESEQPNEPPESGGQVLDDLEGEGQTEPKVEDEEEIEQAPEQDEIEEENEPEEFEDVEIIAKPDDEIISQTIKNPAWQPIGTSQTGEHVSVYEKDHVDWKEKEQALLYATGLSPDNVIFWMIKNGGSPQKSIGIVSSRNQVEMYRVYLEWIDGEGWLPVQLDVLKTLDFDY